MSYGKWNSSIIWDLKKVILPGNEKLIEKILKKRQSELKCRDILWPNVIQINQFRFLTTLMYLCSYLISINIGKNHFMAYMLKCICFQFSTFGIFSNLLLSFLIFIVILILSQPFFNVWKQSFLQILYSPYYVAFEIQPGLWTIQQWNNYVLESESRFCRIKFISWWWCD